MRSYILKVGQTPRMVAKELTGNPERWPELLLSNPRAQKMYVRGGVGYTFSPAWWSAGRLVYLPDSWTKRIGVSGPADGQVGASECEPSSVEPHPTAYYKVSNGKYPADVAVDFNRIVDGHGDYAPLMGANVGFWSPGFYQNPTAGCLMNSWKDGIVIRVPREWLDNVHPTQLAQMKALSHLVTADGTTKWTPPTGGTQPGVTCPQGQFPNPTQGGACMVPPTCAPDQYFDSNTWQCQKKSGTGVGYTEDKGGMPTWGWVALAAGAGIGAALLIANLTKAKKVPVAPGAPALPPARVEEEVVVRR